MALKRNKDGRYYLDDEEEIKQYSAKNRQLYLHPTAEENNAFQAKQRQEQKRIQRQSQAVKQATTASQNAIRGVSSRLTPARVTTMDDLSAKEHEDQMSAAALSNRVTYADVYKPKRKTPVVLPVVKQREQLDNVFKRGMTIDQMNALDHDNQMSAAALSNRVTAADVARKPIVPTREVTKKTVIDRNVLNDDGLSSKELIQKYTDLLNGKLSYSDNTKKALYKQGQKSLHKLTSNYYKSPEWGKIVRGDIPWTETAKEMKAASELMDELYRQSALGAGTLGVLDSMSYGYASNPILASSSIRQQQKEMFGRSQQANPLAYGTGQFIGEAIKYKATAPLLKEIPGVNKLTEQLGGKLSKGASKLPGIGKALGKFATPERMTGLVGDQLLDTVVGTPQVIGDGIEDGKSGWGIAGDLLQNQLTNLGANVGMDLLGEGVKAIGKKGREIYSNHKIDTMPKPSFDEIGVHEVKSGTKLDGSPTNPNYRTDIPEHFLEVSNAAPSSAKLKADFSLFDENILKNTNQARKNYIAYAREHFPDIVKNQETGMEIGISRNGLDKLMSGNITKEKYASAFYVPELIEQATKVAEAPYIKKKTGISRYHYFDSPIEIEGKDYTAHIRVRDTDVGNKYYGHTISVVDGIKIEPGTRGSTGSSVLHSVKEVPDSSELSSSQRTDVSADAVPGEHVQDALSNFDNSVTYSIPENSGKIKGLPVAQRPEPVLLPLAERKHPVSLPIAGKTDVIADTQRRGYNQSGGGYYGRTESQLTGLQDVGRTAQFDTGRGGIYSESDLQNGRTNGGAQSQQTKRITRKIGNVDVEYNLASPEIINNAAKSIQQQFSEYGIDAEIVDGEAGYRRGGKEYTPAPATTNADGSIFVRSDIDMSPENVVNHEIMHYIKRTEPEMYQNVSNVLWESGIETREANGELNDTLQRLVKTYKHDHPDIDLLAGMDGLYEEILSQLAGYHALDPEFAREKFSFIKEYDNVVQAIEQAQQEFKAQRNGRASSAPTDQGGSGPMDILDINEKLKAEREARLARDPLASAMREQYSNDPDITVTEPAESIGTQTVEDAQAAYRQAEPVMRDIVYLESLEHLTEEQQAQLSQLKKQKKALTAPAIEYSRAHKENLRSEMDQLVEGADNWKDKRMGYQYKRETMERNTRDIVQNEAEAEAIIEHIFYPVHESEAKSTRWKADYTERARQLGIGTKKQYEAMVPNGNKLPVRKKVSESTLVQLYGEHKITTEQLKQTGADVLKIQKATEEFRSMYNEFIEQMNEALIRNGYEPVLYRKDYFPHFTETKPDGILAKIANVFGIDVQPDTLPTKIAGKTEIFRPGKKWLSNALHRTTDVTDYDALKGFDRYLDGVSDVIFHTNDIQRLRAFNNAIRDRFSDKGIKREIAEILGNQTLTPTQQEDLISKARSRSTTTLPKFVTELEDYTNSLAGKKSFEDRSFEHNLGRGIYNASKALEGRVAANMVALNPASWITNFIPITQAAAGVKTKNLILGMKEQIASYIKPDSLFNESDFLTNRRGYDTLFKTTGKKIADKMASPMQWIDEFTAGTIERARVHENITDKGMSWKEAIKDADQFTSGIMADRSKGALPTAFNAKNPVSKIFTMFQVEVNNQLSNVFKDVPRDLKSKGAKGVAWGLTKMFLGAFAYNELYEMLTGRRAALDPIDLIREAYGDFTDEDTTKSQAVLNTAENLAEQLPFVGGVLGGGRVPIQSAFPDAENVVKAAVGLASGEMPQNKAWSTLGKEAIKPITYLAFPFGGGQVKKMAESAFTIGQGGNYTLDSDGRKRLRFPATDLNPWNYIQAAAFGPYSLPGAREYVDSGFKSLSANDTEKYQEAAKNGMNSQLFLDTLKEFKKIKADKNENGEITVSRQDNRRQYLLQNETLTPEQKAWWDKAFISEKSPAVYTSPDDFYVSTSPESRQEGIRSLINLGVSTDQIDAVAEKYSEIKKKYEGQKNSARSSATEFSKWLDGKGFTQKQREVIDETYRYWAMTPAESEPYNEATLSEEGKRLYSYDSVKEAVGSVDNFIKAQEILSETKGDKDEYGNTISGTAKQKQIVAIANELNVTSRQAENIYNELRVYKHSLDDLSSSARKRYEVAAAHNMSEKKFLRLYNLYLTVEGSKDANGKTISGSKKRNAIYTFMKNGLSQAQAEYFYQILTAK